MKNLLSFALLAVLIMSCQKQPESKSLADKVADRDYPSIFQAWYGIDMPDQYPVTTEEQRLAIAAKHDFLWEEPLSQLGEKVDLVLGLVWDGKYDGLADSFKQKSLAKAKENKAKLLDMNPNMVHLFEIRWRDAPSTFLPDNSEWWKRDDKGEIVKGWLGGWVPFYILDYDNPEFQDNVARQCKIACESGVYDGVMLDWNGQLDLIKKVRAAIGSEALIIVNIHDDIHDGVLYKDYINGAFMELNPIDDISMPVEELVLFSQDDVNGRTWDKIREALKYYEENFQEPIVNCLEVWGHRDDLPRMRATTTLGLVYSNGYQLYSDPNPLASPDHYHDWYPMWDIDLGRPVAKYIEKEDGSAWRDFENGTVVYNHYGNGEIKVAFDKDMKRASDGTVGRAFTIDNRDGDIFIK